MNSKEARKIYDAFASETQKLFATNPAYKKKFLNILKKLEYAGNPLDLIEIKKDWVKSILTYHNNNWEDSSFEFASVIDELLIKYD